jgi:hypothetical protein
LILSPRDRQTTRLSVGLGHTLQLVLLLDRVRVAASLGGIDQLLGEALSNGLDVAEGRLAGARRQEGDGLVDSSQWGYVDGLSADGAGGADSGRVFSGSAVDNGVDSDLDGVLVRHEMDLPRRGQQRSPKKPPPDLRRSRVVRAYNLERVSNDPDSHELLSVVSAVHHERVRQSLDDGAVGLSESLDGISASRVGNVDGVSERDVITIACSKTLAKHNFYFQFLDQTTE